MLRRKKRSSGTSREDARRFATRVTMGLVVIGGIVALVIAANRWAKKEGIESIRIVGRTILDSAEIMEQAAVPDTMPLQKIDLEAIERRVVEHPFIERASVYRGESGTLVVEIVERAPVAVTLVDGAPVYLDSLGVPLPYRFSTAGFDLPVIAGVERNHPVGDAGAMRDRLDSARTREALAVLAEIRLYDDRLYRQISEIRREGLGEYTLLTADGAVPVRAGYAADIGGRLRKLDLFMTTVLAARGVGKARSIDLRWKGQVVVRWREESGQESHI